jgi:hypothetical protein
MRLAIAAGGVAAMSALLALIGGSALPTAATSPTAAPGSPGGAAGDVAPIRHVVRYVVLAPGQRPPANATSTRPATTIATPVPAPRAGQRPAIVTSQSGRP